MMTLEELLLDSLRSAVHFTVTHGVSNHIADTSVRNNQHPIEFACMADVGTPPRVESASDSSTSSHEVSEVVLTTNSNFPKNTEEDSVEGANFSNDHDLIDEDEDDIEDDEASPALQVSNRRRNQKESDDVNFSLADSLTTREQLANLTEAFHEISLNIKTALEEIQYREERFYDKQFREYIP